MNCGTYQQEIHNLKLVNSQIVNNQQIKKLVPKVEILATYIKSYKIINIQNLHQLLNSHQFQDLVNQLKSLNLTFNFKDSTKNIFPQTCIYFNQFFHRHDYFSFTFIIIPKGMEISLHDHSEMFVVTRILYGQLEIQDMDVDRQYIKVVKFLRTKLQQHRKNKFFIKKHTKPYHSSTVKQEIHSPTGNQHLTEQFYEACLKSSRYQNFDNTNCFRVKNWKKTLVSSPAIKILTPITGNIHRLIAKSDCILLNLFLPDYIDQFHCGYYQYHQGTSNFDQSDPYIFKINSPKEAANLRDLNQMA